MMCGGTGPMSEADHETQGVLDQVRGELEEQVGRNFAECKATHVKRQVVAGTNFFVKAHIGNDEHIHVRIYRPLPGQGGPSVHGFQLNKTKEDPIEYF